MVGVIASLISVIAAFIGVVIHVQNSGAAHQRHMEEKMVSQLTAGKEYERLAQIIGSAPDHKMNLASGRTLYQYERRWEVIQLLVDRSGDVVSIGVYGKDKAFHANFRLGGVKIILGETFIGKALPDDDIPSAANVYCGAHKAGYFEAYSELPLALGGDNIVLGISDIQTIVETVGYDLKPVCTLALLPQCTPPSGNNVVSAGYARCLLRNSKARQFRRSLPLSVVIIAAPGQEITPDMLIPPDDAS